jgi:2,3-bisphosphoglycerate-independent phosphoglycerate mutase
MGNSEVGHMNLGAGRIVYQDLAKINLAFEAGEALTNPTLQKAFEEAAQPGKKLHFIGLVSDGGVHAHINHLKALCSAASQKGLTEVYVHAFTDGRDCDPKSGAGFLNDLESHLRQTTGSVASIVGRYFAMDRDQRWERVKKAYDLLVHGKGTAFASSSEALQAMYANGTTDEFIEPCILKPQGTIAPGDVVINFNFRTDRGREITRVLTVDAFPELGMKPLPLHYVTLTRYDEAFTHIPVVFEKDNLTLTMGEVLERHSKTQIRIAETEKYPHVTFFFSGGREEPFRGEKRIMVPSPKVATYDLQPEMSAYELRDAIVPELLAGSADFVCLNFANPDMVGHTGVMEAAIKACETVDTCAAAVVAAALQSNYEIIILADHGNADCMINPDGSPNTAHTTQPVPVFYVSNAPKGQLQSGVLGDIAPTLLFLMGLSAPVEMTGKNLVA